MNNVPGEHGGILVLAEREGQGIASLTFELLRMGKKIAEETKKPLYAATLGHEMANCAEEISNYVDKVYSLDHPLLVNLHREHCASALEQLCGNLNPDIVLMGHTLANLDLAPRLSFRMGVPIITDCIQLSIAPETGNLLCSKPVYGGKAISTFELKKKPFIVTLRSKAVEPYNRSGPVKADMVKFDPVLDESMARVQWIETVQEENVNLNKAEAIVAGGRGIRDAEGLKLLQELVSVLGKHLNRVELGGSRPLVDARLIPSSRQIGLTGEKVAPAIYIAVGISGSLQHMTGILGAKKIIAINSNPKAPIFAAADYGVIGNFEDVLPALIKKLREFECHN
jgi:electron transfer flavoprotein alpha subunit